MIAVARRDGWQGGRIARALALSLVALGYAGPAFSLSFDQCGSSDHHFGDWKHRNIGHGHVTYHSYGSYDGNTSSRLLVESCRGGRILVVGRLKETNGQDSAWPGADYDRSHQVDAIFEAVLKSKRSYTLDDLFDLYAAEFDSDVRLMTSNDESCACHVAYPYLRGTKQVFVNSDPLLMQPKKPGKDR